MPYHLATPARSTTTPVFLTRTSSTGAWTSPACQLQESHLSYQVSLGNGEIHRPEFRCSRCGGPLEEDDQIRRLEVCPVCGSRTLMEGMGEWD